MPEQMTIAIVDDEQDMRESISQWLTLSGHKTLVFASAQQALEQLDSSFEGIIISDIKMPGMDGIKFLKRLNTIDNALPVILITGHGDVAMAVEAMRLGAYDFLEKPFNPEKMAELAKKALLQRRITLENRTLRKELSDGTMLINKMMGKSQIIRQLREDILDLSQADGNILVTGEIGTGRTMIAQALHACGPRQGKRFVTVNCAAFTEDELGNRLFGVEADEPCAIKDAMLGTLCLEEIEAMGDALQARLLAKLSELDRGEDSPPLRIIGVSNEDTLAGLEGKIRDDLFFRLSAMHLRAPSLRERGEDVLLLFNAFCETFADEYGCDQPEITAEDAANLLQAPWPGNIRQLRNLAERTVLQSRRGSYSITKMLLDLSDDDLPLTQSEGKPLKEHVEAFERMLIDNTMRRHHGSIQAVMKELSLPRRTLNEKMSKYGLSRSSYTRSSS